MNPHTWQSLPDALQLGWTYPIVIAKGLILGALSSILPCSGVYQVAVAFSIMGSREGQRLKRGFSYCAARGITHGVLGALILIGIDRWTAAGAAAGGIMLKLSGPLLMICSVFMLSLIEAPGGIDIRVIRDRGFSLSQWGVPGAFSAGVVLSLAPCPEGAALFFGVLLPGLSSEGLAGTIVGASSFGVGSALPPLLAAFLASSAAPLGLGGAIMRDQERIRKLGAIGLMGAGLYMTLAHVYHLF
ncbi:hypothetical protein TheveDRAFT_0405 [Thermanaerovibrio velox DSM 12556]|uniref:Urease accessory protein UreH-like transmembrane domain-containing protein n=1 Tax=Thermanaerovibrio velox DSM 12556 TaxID=926567 RepID=H0UPM2_9BACT|nr:hypothetical protein [Thermanaerovibrio velox]EHM09569.1 hypothetical protein TheveDRAFT_0405 [Thermanaerovibrio velox DSM 12556]